MGDEAFRELSAMDPKGSDLLDKVHMECLECHMFNMHKGLNVDLFLFVYLYIFRPWLKIRVTSGLPNTTDRKLPLELLELASKLV